MCLRMFFCLTCVFAACLAVNTGGLVAAEQPNIVVFLVDDMGVMDTSVPFLTDEDGKPKRYPLNEFYRTPSMKRLSDMGVRFNNFYAMSVCSPTRCSTADAATTKSKCPRETAAATSRTWWTSTTVAPT